jgi:integrase
MKSGAPPPPLRATRLLAQVRERLRYGHYSLSTERSHVYWVRWFMRFHSLRHPREMGAPEVEAFLSWLANYRGASVTTHEQALSALVFLYRQVQGADLPWLQEVGRPRTPQRLPVVMSRAEVQHLLAATTGEHQLVFRLMYGIGMRTKEALRLRVKDVNFERRLIVVCEGKGHQGPHHDAA